MKKNWLFIISIIIWLVIGIYGIFFNITYIDEAKYLIKGWLMTTGQVGYYSTPEFFYQHMPGGLLWYGIGQKSFGPSLLVARIQSFLIGLLVIVFTYKLAGLINTKAKKNILPILSLAPVAILYYSEAVPQSIAAFSLIFGFYWLFKNRYRLATLSFCSSFLIRENFLFTLILYLLFLIVVFRKDIKELVINFLIAFVVLGIFIIPGWPGILNVLKNFPGVSMLLPINAAEKAVLGLNWMQVNYNLNNYLLAIREFGVVYFSFLLVGLIALIKGIKNKMIWAKDNRWRFLLLIALLNFFAHTWSAFQLSPRAIIPYFAYFSPLLAVIISKLLKEKIRFYYWLLFLAIISLPIASIFQLPNRKNALRQLSLSADSLKPIVANKQNIVWLAEPMSLYLAGRVSYYPLINHTNFYKPSADTTTVKKLGLWNLEMMNQWLDEADLLVIDPNRLSFAKIDLTQELADKWLPIVQPPDIWPKNLMFYEINESNR